MRRILVVLIALLAISAPAPAKATTGRPMHPVLKAFASLVRPTRTLRLESVPLHTETAASAAQAPAQVRAALKRGAHVLAFTEVGRALSAELAPIAAAHGYDWVHGSSDTALAVKSRLHATHKEVEVIRSRTLLSVTFEFNGHQTTVYAMHWGTNGHSDSVQVREAQNKALIDALDSDSAGGGISFFMGDSNPTRVLRDPAGSPRAALNAAGIVLIYQEARSWPPHIGVNMIGRPEKDGRVRGVRVFTHAPLGSDHYPVTAVYRVR